MSADYLLDPLAVAIAAACFAALFAHAALLKVSDLPLLEQQLSVYGAPAASLPLLRLAVPLWEGAVALALLSPWRQAGLLAAALLLAGYGALMGWHRWHGHALDCGCGGDPLPVSWALVARNTVMALLAAAAAWPMGQRALVAADFGVIAAALVLATLLVAALNQVLRQQADLARRFFHSN